MTNNSKTRVTGSLLRGLEILRAFRPGCGAMGNSELVQATGLPKATVSRLTRALVEASYLNYQSWTGKFELSAAVLSLGYAVVSNMPIRKIAHEPLQALANAIGEAAASLACPDRVSMVYVERIPGKGLPYILDIGSRVDMAHTATGRAYLAALDSTQRKETLNMLAAYHGDEWKVLSGQVQTSIAEVEKNGYCVVVGEWRQDACAVAAPLVLGQGETAMSINCAGPPYAMPFDRCHSEIGPRLVHLCQSLSNQH